MPAMGERLKRDRIASASGAAAFHLLLGYALIWGLGVDVPRRAEERLKLFEVREPPPPPPEVEAAPALQPAKVVAKVGGSPAAPAPSQVLAPPPEVRLEAAPPLVAAPVPGAGAGALAGSASGSGSGAGRGGNGNGAGSAGGGLARSARLIGGALLDSDYPRAARRKRAEGIVFLSFKVTADGGVSDCIVTRSSGHAELDATTCRLIERRFRYAPALDVEGKAVPDLVAGRHAWWIGRRKGGGAGTR
jgi:protein TonB